MRAAFLTVLLAVFSANAQVKDPWTQPHALVPDKETAIKIAEAVLFPIYGEGRISGERPYKVTLTDGFWRVTGSLPPTLPGEVMFGGTFYITISQWDARVIEIGHEE
ncbi:MAG: hypothetical protein DMF27_12960 [Verrucomicrobia bacterium]|nr:MAG: hypothetical protein DMF27_12960 [Verrucomicrobiota bacterium]